MLTGGPHKLLFLLELSSLVELSSLRSVWVIDQNNSSVGRIG